VNKPAQEPLKILVVDDYIDSAEIVATLLSMTGHNTRSATNGKDALDIWEKFRPDMVITDISMPIMDGLEMVKILRASPGGDRVVVVGMTGYSTPDQLWEGFDLNLLKPITMDLLNAIVTRARVTIGRRQDDTSPA
jgi:CheY-like chemotaxis protein